MSRSICSIEGCGRPAKVGESYCAPHKRRYLKYGDPLEGGPISRGRPRTYSKNDKCSVNGCTRPKSSRGLCTAHYQRMRINNESPQEMSAYIRPRGSSNND